MNSSKKSDALSTYNQKVDQVSSPTKGSVCDSASQNGDAAQCNAEVADAKDSYDSAKAHDIPGYIGVAVGGVALVTGVVLLLTGESVNRYDPPAKEAKSKAPGWSFAAGPGQFGLALRSAF
ncbi:MAG: hypothetical protein WDO69_05845 [Pseudomonadota bacterium]